jgi:hypothetical protein
MVPNMDLLMFIKILGFFLTFAHTVVSVKMFVITRMITSISIISIIIISITIDIISISIIIIDCITSTVDIIDINPIDIISMHRRAMI